ncbi:MAG: hypothetical protein ACKV1O_23715 [Saprospiraceae bacterium]
MMADVLPREVLPFEQIKALYPDIIKEPEGIDLNLAPLPLSEEDRRAISAIIAEYRKSGKIPKVLRKKRGTESLKAADASLETNPPSTVKTVKKKRK